MKAAATSTIAHVNAPGQLQDHPVRTASRCRAIARLGSVLALALSAQTIALALLPEPQRQMLADIRNNGWNHFV